MLGNKFQLVEEKYLFTFQDETKLWISREFIEKYPQFHFYDIIKHSEKYDDGSYYIDIPSLSMKKVIDFLMEDNVDIDSLNLKDSYDIYETVARYSVKIDNEIQSDLLIHVKELFYKYLKDNNYDIYVYHCNYIKSRMPIDLFSLEEKRILINGLITQQLKNELLYYSLLFKMMNITKVKIKYDYAWTIPVEYICPSCIQDIFPSLHELTINVTTRYKKTNQLLNPNRDEYIVEYTRLFSGLDYEIKNPEKYEYYTKSEMNEYNKISNLDLNHIYYSQKLINSYNEKREKNELPKLYKYIVHEVIYTNDYSRVEICETEDEYILDDQISIEYDYITKDKTFYIDKVSSEHGISQLLCLRSYLSISNIKLKTYNYLNYDLIIITKLFEEGVFDSLTVLNVCGIKELTHKVNDNLFNIIMTTCLFPNVTKLLYKYDESFQLSSITKECFPKLHIINYETKINTYNFKSLFPDNLMNMIDTIRIYGIDNDQKKEIAFLLDNVVYTHSIHIDKIDITIYNCLLNFPHLKEIFEKNLVTFNSRLSIYSSSSGNIKILDSIEKCKQNIYSFNLTFEDDHHDKIDKRNALESFLKSNILEYLNDLTISLDYKINMEYLIWISTLFNDNKFNTIRKLTINLHIKEDSSSEYLAAYEKIFEKIIPKASIVNIKYCTMTFINRLIPKGCFHNTTQLFIDIKDIPDDNFCKLYTTDNFPQLKYIKIYKNDKEWLFSFIKTFCTYMNNNNFPLSSIFRLGQWEHEAVGDYIYDPDNSILRCKYDNNSFMNTIIGSKDIYDKEQLSKLINFITTGKFPKLKEFYFNVYFSFSDEQIDICKQQLKDSSFIQKNHVNYLFD
ncbi:hypothetical protein WA158_006894 [Blastocystis sp. Blastoise]